MNIVYAKEELPVSITKSIFLAGPTPRDRKNVKSWRPEALAVLAGLGYDGTVFVPEDRASQFIQGEYLNQIEWEEYCLNVADCIVFWVPRVMATMPALTTNVEYGMWYDSGKIVLGAPDRAVSVRYLQYYAGKYRIPSFNTLEDTLKSALKMIGNGSLRVSGEREVPLCIWQNMDFKNWYVPKKMSGQILNSARVVWIYRMDQGDKDYFSFALRVKIGKSDTRDKIVIFSYDNSEIIVC